MANMQLQYANKRNKWRDAYTTSIHLSVEDAQLIDIIDNDNYTYFQPETNPDIDEYNYYNYEEPVKYQYNLSCIRKLNGNEIFPASITFYIRDEKYTADAPAKLKLKDYTIDLSDVKNVGKYLKGYGYNFTTRTPILPATARQKMEAYATQKNNQIEAYGDSLNAVLLSNPYNVDSAQFSYSTLIVSHFFSTTDADNVYSGVIEEIDSTYNALNSGLADKLYKSNPDKYKEVVYKTNPEIEQKVTESYRNYKCHYSEAEYARALILNEKLKTGNCKKETYKEYKDLYFDNCNYDNQYSSYCEFDEWYERGEEEFEANLAERQKYAETIKTYKDKFYSVQKNGSYTSYYTFATYCNFQGVNDLQNLNKDATTFLELLEKLRTTIFADDAIAYFVRNNVKAKKEYEKVSQYFENKWQFWDVYSTANYKQYIKEQKKKK